MAISKENTSALILMALMVMATVLSSCNANNEKQIDALPLPDKCYSMELPNCTKEACEKLCNSPGGYCRLASDCCCPVS
ncbi:hypothetical protein CFC21_066971 [Triticum aestivum]|uniref:Knottin scorpion toxin-like domain-containing protein n=2 Tax=Triticum aestivum TaxID=4565 RepID=A0A9R1KNA4_WHEAT|nr:hypothetical protein CFC21_066971 [Triticum aestivum]